jgi:2-oxoglutarate ferredoxin oxidoreductase subunit gamma
MARDEFKPRVFNMLILGAIVAASNVLPLKMVEEGLLVKLGDKLQRDPELRELNLRALAQGASYVIERSQEEGSRLE